MRQLTYRGPPTALFMTAICYALLCLLLCCFHVSCFISKGHFAVTGPEYYGYAYHDKDGDDLARYEIPKGVNPGSYCQRVCMRHKKCSSFVIIKKETCHLKTFNTCLEDRILLRSRDKVHYDLRDGNSSELWNTCFNSCMKTNQDCNACGRGINCGGHLCRDCVTFCWEIDPPPELANHLFVNAPTEYYVFNYTYCDREWQLIWNNHNGLGPFKRESVFAYRELDLKLQMRIFYENNEIKYFYFDGVIANKDVLSVGNILNESDTQANNWNAPFSNRAVLIPVDANCLPFFYDVDPCPTNNTYDSPRFIWPVDEDSDAVRIINIDLWVTPHNLTKSP